MHRGAIAADQDTVNYQGEKVRAPGDETNERIVVRGKMLGQNLPRNRMVEH